ncbi:MAG TPA: phenylalanine--tRNA ligase beta subunit-related protein, partial [bacterium]|nr:phenylalanine--tRNA ligase beta subunit-related protein [bacterium]
MKYSLNMLGEYVNGKWSEDQVEHWLQMLGLNPLFTRKNNDVFIELEIPSNRGDLLSALGIIRALTPYMEIEPKYPDIDLQEKSARKLSVEIESPDDCFFYAGRVIESVSIGPSPEWLRERVESAGFRSVNNVVDITNLVFWEFGQPLHAFDIDLLKEKIIVRRAREGEEIITLDGTKRNLCNDVLVISDSEKPVALAGIMGGINSEVGPNT